MSDPVRDKLRQALIDGYQELRRAISRRSRSPEEAGDVLHDTYLRLQTARLGEVDNARGYLFRAAANVASDRARNDARRLTVAEADGLLDSIADEAPSPETAAESRSEFQALERALAELPPRRRQIFYASVVDEIPHDRIAARYGVTVRTVQIDLKAAIEHCAERLGRGAFARSPRRTS